MLREFRSFCRIFLFLAQTQSTKQKICSSNDVKVTFGLFPERSEHCEKRLVGATLVVAPLPADTARKTGRPQGSPLQQAMLEDLARTRTGMRTTARRYFDVVVPAATTGRVAASAMAAPSSLAKHA